MDSRGLSPQGGGEPAITIVGAVLANAARDACGARLYELPMTPARSWKRWRPGPPLGSERAARGEGSGSDRIVGGFGFVHLPSGELHRRAEEAVAALAHCRLCPRDCGVDRLAGKWSACKTGRYAVVSSAFAHRGEEDCLPRAGGGLTGFASQSPYLVWSMDPEPRPDRTERPS